MAKNITTIADIKTFIKIKCNVGTCICTRYHCNNNTEICGCKHNKNRHTLNKKELNKTINILREFTEDDVILKIIKTGIKTTTDVSFIRDETWKTAGGLILGLDKLRNYLDTLNNKDNQTTGGGSNVVTIDKNKDTEIIEYLKDEKITNRLNRFDVSPYSIGISIANEWIKQFDGLEVTGKDPRLIKTIKKGLGKYDNIEYDETVDRKDRSKTSIQEYLQKKYEVNDYHSFKQIYNYPKIDKHFNLKTYLKKKLKSYKLLSEKQKTNLLLIQSLPYELKKHFFNLQKKEKTKEIASEKVINSLNDQYLKRKWDIIKNNNNKKNNNNNNNKYNNNNNKNKNNNNNKNNYNNNNKNRSDITLWIPYATEEDKEKYQELINETKPDKTRNGNKCIFLQYTNKEECLKAKKRIDNASIKNSYAFKDLYSIEKDSPDLKSIERHTLIVDLKGIGLYPAKIDTGSAHTIIPSNIADQLKTKQVKLEQPLTFKIANSKKITYTHKVNITFDTIHLRGISTEALVGCNIDKILLGDDFIDKFNLKIGRDSVKINNVNHLYLPYRYNLKLLEKKHVFKFRGFIKGYVARIIQTTKKNILGKAFTIPFHLQELSLEEFQILKDLGIVQRSKAVQNENSLIVKVKKDGKSLRFMHVTAKLEETMEKIPPPNVNTQQVFSNLHGQKYHTKLDLIKAFHQIKLDPRDRHLTAFTGPDGLKYEYTSIMQGLSSSPTHCDFAVKQALKSKIPGTINIYYDDTFISDKTDDNHFKSFSATLDRADINNVSFGYVGSYIRSPKIVGLGFEVVGDGRILSEDRVSAIRNIQIPNSCKQLKSVLASLNYVREFVNNFSDKTAPLFALTSKAKYKKLTKEQAKIIEDIKEELIRNDKLIHAPDKNKPITVTVDAGELGWAGTLKQGNKIISITGRKFNKYQQVYNSSKKELYSIYQIFKRNHYLLQSANIILKSDCKVIIDWLKNHDLINDVTQFRWIQFIRSYNPQFVHVNRDEVALEDSFGRILINKLTPSLQNIINNPTQEILKENIYNLHIQTGHSNLFNLARHFYNVAIPNKISIIRNCITQCTFCQLNGKLPPKQFKPRDSPPRIFHTLSIDIVPFGQYNIIFVIDCFSRYTTIKLIKGSVNSTHIINFFKKFLLSKGPVKFIIPDAGTNLNSTELQQFLSNKEISLKAAPSNAQHANHAESIIKLFKRKHSINQRNTSKEHINLTISDLNNQANSITKYSPNELIYGFNNNNTAQVVKTVDDIRQEALINTNHFRSKMIINNNRSFNKDDKVLAYYHINKKDSNKWYGPLLVDTANNNILILKDINNKKIKTHINFVKKYINDDNNPNNNNIINLQNKNIIFTDNITNSWYEWKSGYWWFFGKKDSEQNYQWFRSDHIYTNYEPIKIEEKIKQQLLKIQDFSKDKINNIYNYIINITQKDNFIDLFDYDHETVKQNDRYEEICQQPITLSDIKKLLQEKEHNKFNLIQLVMKGLSKIMTYFDIGQTIGEKAYKIYQLINSQINN